MAREDAKTTDEVEDLLRNSWITRAESVLAADFDPASNEQDRRILYEVTGLRLYSDEFIDSESTDSQDEVKDDTG